MNFVKRLKIVISLNEKEITHGGGGENFGQSSCYKEKIVFRREEIGFFFEVSRSQRRGINRKPQFGLFLYCEVMFETCLPFELISVRYERDNSFHMKTDIFRVVSRTAKYIIEVEVYVRQTYVLKFYPLRYKRLKNKYRYISGDNILKELLGTCLSIFKQYFDKFPGSSFGFIATGSIVGEFQEDQDNINDLEYINR